MDRSQIKNKLRSVLRARHIRLPTILAALAGAIAGLGIFTFVYADGFSYVGSSPETCTNCHVMQGAYAGWSHSSHKDVALCVDCHAPHTPIEKYAVKGINGVKDMFAFTLDIIPEPIHIRPFNHRIVQDRCVECHRELVQTLRHLGESPDCLRCHANVGHDY